MGEWGHALLGVAMSTTLIWVVVYVPVRLVRWVTARNQHRPHISASSLYWLLSWALLDPIFRTIAVGMLPLPIAADSRE